MAAVMSFIDYLDWLSQNHGFLATKSRKAKRPTHPGQILWREYLMPRQMSQTELARLAGCTHAKINEIVHGKRSITPQFALDLEVVFGVSAEYWVSIQASYDLDRARRNSKG